MSAYREPAEMPTEPPEPVWPRIRALLGRLSLLVLIVAGPVIDTNIGIGIGRTFNAAVFFWILYAVLGSIAPLVMKAAPDSPKWIENRSWPWVVLFAAWAPFAFPMLGLYRVGRWVRTGR